MADSNDRIHLDTNEARAATTTGRVRWILGASLLLVIVIFAAILLS